MASSVSDIPNPAHPATVEPGAPIGFAEFVSLAAALMALTALGIDSMLPALPAIGRSLSADGNARQFVVTAFVAGFGVAQLVHGPLADRYGRRRLLLWSLGLYALFNIAAALAGSFAWLLVARIAAGAAIAATRVAVVAMVRDCYHGRAMARVMSIAFIIFMIVPVLAPTFGSAVLLVADWRGIFWTIAGVAAAVFAWFALRMPETLPVADRQPISPARIVRGWALTLGDRWSLGYTLASAALMGALYGYLNSIQQIAFETFAVPRLLPVVFAATAATMAAANLFNARLVMRLGTRAISHGALLVLIVIAGLHVAIIASGHESLPAFMVLQAVAMGCFGLSTSNFSAMAMENMGSIAGVASSVQGFASVTLGVAIGAGIGLAYDGTALPLTEGFLGAGIVALLLAAITERGRLFRPV